MLSMRLVFSPRGALESFNDNLLMQMCTCWDLIASVISFMKATVSFWWSNNMSLAVFASSKNGLSLITKVVRGEIHPTEFAYEPLLTVLPMFENRILTASTSVGLLVHSHGRWRRKWRYAQTETEPVQASSRLPHAMQSVLVRTPRAPILPRSPRKPWRFRCLSPRRFLLCVHSLVKSEPKKSH